jgi:hypothetical protein
MGTARRVLFAVWFSGGGNNDGIRERESSDPATEENAQVEENTLQIEELESRLAPTGAPMPPPWVD